jgi:type IV secretion system protein VirB8
MTTNPKDEREDYYRGADEWARDRRERDRKLLRVAWIIAIAATLVAVLEAFALIALTPLKTVVPYTILVDRHTGYIQAVDPVRGSRITADAALTKSFLVQYVTARESFDVDSLQANYRKVALWSAERARSEYIAAMQGTNPESPLRRYPRGTVIEVRVKSVSTLGSNVSMVRFDTVRRDAGGQATVTGAWAAVIRYRYSNADMPAEDRYINPLGFQVLRYRRSAEALPPPEPQTVTVMPTGVTGRSFAPVPVPGPVPSPVAGADERLEEEP